MQTVKTSGRSDRVMDYQKKVSKDRVLGSKERTRCVDSSMAWSRRCRIVGTLGNVNLGWRMGMALGVEKVRSGWSGWNADDG